jgi:Na+/H+-dicarboxylate symporter
MKKFKLGLFPRVVIAIVVGALLGLILPEVVIRIFKTFNVLFAQLLKFIVPLLVLGLVTPSIANLGRGAGKMLLTVMAIAYCSTVCAGIFSYGVSSNLLPMYLSPGELSSEFVSEKEYLPYDLWSASIREQLPWENHILWRYFRPF